MSANRSRTSAVCKSALCSGSTSAAKAALCGGSTSAAKAALCALTPNKQLRKLIIVLGPLIFTACATTTTEKSLRNMLVAGAVGAAIGASKEEFKTSHAIMYGSSAAAVAAALSLWVYDPDKEIAEAKRQAEFYKSQLDSFDSKKLETRSAVGGKIPEKYKNLILPGELNISQIDQWVDDGENRLIHQDQIVELMPPSLRPIQKQIKKESK